MNASARDPSAFAGLVVGVNNYSTQPAGPSTGSFNGGQTYQNETYIEGLPLTNAGTESDTRNLAFGVSVEAVEQFQIETTGAKAMYEGQGVSNYVLKSGGNQFHGGVYEYFRNTHLRRPRLLRADHAGGASERIRRDHQRPDQEEQDVLLRQLRWLPFRLGHLAARSSRFPRRPRRTGDFSAFPQVIYDPTSATGTGGAHAVPGQYHPGEPHSRRFRYRWRPIFPPPTNGGIQNNYLAVLPQTINNDSTTNKVDLNLTDKNRVFALFSTGKYTTNFTGQLCARHLGAAAAVHAVALCDRVRRPPRRSTTSTR